MVVTSDRSSSNTCTSSAVIHEAGMPWGSTNVNETGSQADRPVRAKETSRLSTAASGEMLSTIPPPRSIWVEPGRGGRGVAVGRESVWVAVWVLPLAAEWLWTVQAWE